MVGASREPFPAVAQRVVELERAGLDVVLVAEAYSFDAISRVGYLAAVTERITIGTGIINVYSRTATAIGQTAAGCDYVSGGRFLLGLGTSGPQVIEGFHGVPYEKPRSTHARRDRDRPQGRRARGADPRRADGDRPARRRAPPGPGSASR